MENKRERRAREYDKMRVRGASEGERVMWGEDMYRGCDLCRRNVV